LLDGGQAAAVACENREFPSVDLVPNYLRGLNPGLEHAPRFTMVVRKVSARFKTPLAFEEWDVV